MDSGKQFRPSSRVLRRPPLTMNRSTASYQSHFNPLSLGPLHSRHDGQQPRRDDAGLRCVRFPQLVLRFIFGHLSVSVHVYHPCSHL